jgi:hypothetical protein
VWAQHITIDLRIGIGWSFENIGAAVVENLFAKDSSRQFRQVML